MDNLDTGVYDFTFPLSISFRESLSPGSLAEMQEVTRYLGQVRSTYVHFNRSNGTPRLLDDPCISVASNGIFAMDLRFLPILLTFSLLLKTYPACLN